MYLFLLYLCDYYIFFLIVPREMGLNESALSKSV